MKHLICENWNFPPDFRTQIFKSRMECNFHCRNLLKFSFLLRVKEAIFLHSLPSFFKQIKKPYSWPLWYNLTQKGWDQTQNPKIETQHTKKSTHPNEMHSKLWSNSTTKSPTIYTNFQHQIWLKNSKNLVYPCLTRTTPRIESKLLISGLLNFAKSFNRINKF